MMKSRREEDGIKSDYWSAKFPSKILKEEENFNYDKLFELTQNDSRQPPVQYRIQFLKTVIKKMEQYSGLSESLEKWYDRLEIVSAGNQTEPFYRLYDVDLTLGSKGDKMNGSYVKIYEDEKAFVSDGSTGFVTWNASLQLAKWMNCNLESLQFVNEKPWIYELGCGAGMLGILLTAGRKLDTYYATDCHAGVIQRCQQNIEANGLGDKITTEIRDWVADRDLLLQDFKDSARKLGKRGILLGADIVFDDKLLGPLSTIVCLFLEIVSSGIVLISSTVRNPETYNTLKIRLGEHSLATYPKYNWNDDNGFGEILQVEKVKGNHC